MAEKESLENLNKELFNLGGDEPKAEQPAEKKSAKPRKKQKPKTQKAIIATSRRKMARARATITKGNGTIRVNGFDISTIRPHEMREVITEPIYLSSMAKEIASKHNISVNVSGGGRSAQANAIRSSIARAIYEVSKNEEIKRSYMAYDRTLMVDDIRQVEPKKPKGPKARAKFQKSYR